MNRFERLVACCVLCLTWACGSEAPERTSASPSARRDIVQSLLEDLSTDRHPSDGGGHVVMVESPEASVEVGGTGRWVFEYEAGPLGIAEDGWLFFQAPPFWGWSTPQATHPQGLGFTRVSTGAEGVELEPETVDQQLMAIRIVGGALEEGEKIRVEYGAGPVGAQVDRYAETRSRFWFAVDGDGDGVRAPVPGPLYAEITAGPPAGLQLNLTSTARPGDSVRMTLAVLDVLGNAVVAAVGEIELESLGDSLEIPERIVLEPGGMGRATIEWLAEHEGIYRIRAVGLGELSGLETRGNPLVVSKEGHRILWGDLHGHSGLSDGTGTPDEYYRYARDIASLDVVSLTDHDHWGMEPLSAHPDLWREIRRATERYYEPGVFVTVLGYEWTNWIHGHRHVLFFEGGGEVLSSLDDRFNTPDKLWSALRGRKALTFAHHSAGGPVATNWDYPPDPELEPVTEIVSVHGSSEAADSPGRIYSAVGGNFVRDALARGYELGFVGSGDSHDGHPGLSHIASGSGGLAAILSEDATREGVLEALRARRTYATNGPRIVLRASLDGFRMGSVVSSSKRLRGDSPLGPGAGGLSDLRVVVVAADELEKIEVVRSGQVVEVSSCEATLICSLARRIPSLDPGEYLYVRVIQRDGGAAWSSPFFAESPQPGN